MKALRLPEYSKPFYKNQYIRKVFEEIEKINALISSFELEELKNVFTIMFSSSLSSQAERSFGAGLQSQPFSSFFK